MARKGKRIFIANRGEIAKRIAQSVRELGHVSVGAYTSYEKNAAHLEYCDEWIFLSGKKHSDTFLNIEKLIDLCKSEKIDAVHPGYGFLSENAAFGMAVSAAGMVFIGPNAQAISLMGDKGKSKEFAARMGVPVVPGSEGEVSSLDEALEIAERISYPVLLKASQGGGGKGMRASFTSDELKKNFHAVKRESLSSFGSEAVLIEKLIENPHHIEVQILANKKGEVFHFFERECSVQRRHQKIIEECPSPFIGDDEELRAKICNAAVKLAKGVNYDSAGTVEFIMGEDRQFYFLEMNTRIQVEHGITEEITNFDLIASMIQGALGEDDPQFPRSQKEIARIGHAIECRICAEDPITMLPAPGKVRAVYQRFPTGVRFDHAFYEGLTITSDFDPMIGKLIARGKTREVALRKMRSALAGLLIEGIQSNIVLHQAIMEEGKFLKGEYSTSYLNENKFSNIREVLDEREAIQTILRKITAYEAERLGR